VIDAYGGRVVWSDYDASIGAWRLMERSGGATRAVPVAPRTAAFDVDLGPDGHGGTLAVYSRCTRQLPAGRPTPELERGMYGCNVYAYSFRTGREAPVKSANSGADETWPAVWGSRIAFVRTFRQRRDRFGRHIPYVYWRARRAKGASHRVRLPATPRRQAALVDGVELRGSTVAYAWRGIDDFSTYSFSFRSTLGGRPEAVARGAWFGSGAADSLKTVGAPALGARGVDWLLTDAGHPEYRAAFLRRRGGHGVEASTPVAKAAAFAHDGDTAHWIDAGSAGGSDATSQPGGTFPLVSDDAVRYRPVPRSWLTIPPPH
jgi:hypothetical protein